VQGKFRLAVGFAIAAVSLAVQAQEGLRDRDPVLAAAKKVASDLQAATFHYESFYLLSRFEIADLGYGAQYATPLGTTSGGFSIAASAPHRLYYVPSRRVVFSVEAVPQYAWVHEKGAHSQFGYSSRADAQFILNHIYLDFYGTRANELRPHTGELNRVLTVKDSEVGLNGEIKYTSRTSALFSARYRDASYPTNRLQPVEFENLIPLLDRSERNYRASILHKTFPITSLVLAGERSEYEFRRDPIRNSSRTYAGFGFVTDSGNSVLRAEVGPAKLTFRQPGVRDFSGLIGNATASRRVGERWRVNVSGQRDLDFSIYGGNGYYVADRAGITADYSATRRLAFRILSEWGRDRYDTALPGLALRRDNIAWNAVGWTYQMRRLRGGFDVGYYNRTSTVPDVDDTHGIRFVVHVSFTP
jgi:uncharacterized protein YfiM (DUF2279 family)